MFIKAICYGTSIGSNDPSECYIETKDIYKLRRKGVDTAGNAIEYECYLRSDSYHIYVIDTSIAEQLINDTYDEG